MGAKEISVTKMEKKTARPTVRDERSIILIRSSSVNSFVFPIRCFAIIRQFLIPLLPILCKHFRSLQFQHLPNRQWQGQYHPTT